MKQSTGQYYLTFKRIKIRYKATDLGYFNHPFNSNNRMMLLDDVHLDKPLSEISLAETFEGVDMNNRKGSRSAKTREIIDNDEPLFDFSSSI